MSDDLKAEDSQSPSRAPTVVPQDELKHNSSLEEDPTLENEKRDSSSPVQDLEKTEPVAATSGADDDRYLTGMKLFLVFVGFMLSILLIALDQTIVATALPKIVSHFNALEQVSWVASAYFLTQAGLMLFMGQVLTIAPVKWVYIGSIGVFEIGSLFCAVAPSMNFLIFGRAVAGCGAAGLFIAVLSIIAQVTRLEDRPVLFGTFGAVFAVSSVCGPLLGGVLTSDVSWRWCFYINLPFGAIAIGSVVLFLHVKPTPQKQAIMDLSLMEKLRRIDWIGTILCVGMVTSLLLPLQWGGNTKPWNDKSVIALLVVFGVLLVMFLGWEFYMGKDAMLPLWLFKRRTLVGCALEAFFIFMLMLLGIYYLPLWYQAKGQSPSKSGVSILGFMLGLVVAAGVSGGIIAKTGRYWPFLFLSPLLSSVAAGLIFTVAADTPNKKLLGFQILFGIGLGGAMQNTIIATQTEFAFEEEMIPQATSIVNFLQLVGGVLGISIGSTLFGNQLVANLPKYTNGLTPDQIFAVRSSVTAIFTLPEELQQGVTAAYVASLDRVFILGVPAGALAALSALLIKNYSVKERGSAVTMAAA
ncbi:ABC transporter [Sistotremastrum niveocremeum HHB9708]|uniref:ABC transporter n=1 Tax=Sistotremastrum niveocremeum HHB9708 TaxID=1314777 RepID=A0A164Z6F5_9AGAM|nr:ABC transporter [Sistotremastrum niveocremeum HHB9708]